MKPDLVDILACPTCKQPLALAVTEEADGEVITGTLSCGACALDYPIAAGIPDLLPQK